jgi:hypothetical protein
VWLDKAVFTPNDTAKDNIFRSANTNSKHPVELPNMMISSLFDHFHSLVINFSVTSAFIIILKALSTGEPLIVCFSYSMDFLMNSFLVHILHHKLLSASHKLQALYF